MQRFATGQEATLTLRPDQPVYCFRPQVLAEDAQRFMALFPGKTAYAVKTNGEPMVIETLLAAGIGAFDVASPGEIEAVRSPHGLGPTAGEQRRSEQGRGRGDAKRAAQCLAPAVAPGDNLADRGTAGRAQRLIVVGLESLGPVAEIVLFRHMRSLSKVGTRTELRVGR